MFESITKRIFKTSIDTKNMCIDTMHKTLKCIDTMNISIDTESLSIDTELGSSSTWHKTLKYIDTSVYVSIPVDEYRYSPQEYRYRAWQ